WCMSPRAAEIVALVRALPEDVREEVLDELLRGDSAVTWTPELQRRAEEAMRGENVVDMDEALAEIRAKLRRVPGRGSRPTAGARDRLSRGSGAGAKAPGRVSPRLGARRARGEGVELRCLQLRRFPYELELVLDGGGGAEQGAARVTAGRSLG